MVGLDPTISKTSLLVASFSGPGFARPENDAENPVKPSP